MSAIKEPDAETVTERVWRYAFVYPDAFRHLLHHFIYALPAYGLN